MQSNFIDIKSKTIYIILFYIIAFIKKELPVGSSNLIIAWLGIS